MNFGTNWKTTTLGIAAIFTAGAHLATALSSGDFNTAIPDVGVMIAGAVGLFAKDHNVTGGNVRQ